MGYSETQIIENMRDAGCSEECIQEFLKQYHSGCQSKCDKLLDGHRRDLLDSLHQEQKRIECLDYLVYRMKKSQENGTP